MKIVTSVTVCDFVFPDNLTTSESSAHAPDTQPPLSPLRRSLGCLELVLLLQATWLVGHRMLVPSCFLNTLFYVHGKVLFFATHKFILEVYRGGGGLDAEAHHRFPSCKIVCMGMDIFWCCILSLPAYRRHVLMLCYICRY